LIKEDWIRGMIEVVGEGPEIMLKRAREKDEEVVKSIEEMKNVGVKALRGVEWKIERELVLKEGKVYMPKNKKFRLEVI